MTRSTEDAVRRAIDDYRALEVDEIMFVPVTADIAEVDRLANLHRRPTMTARPASYAILRALLGVGNT